MNNIKISLVLTSLLFSLVAYSAYIPVLTSFTLSGIHTDVLVRNIKWEPEEVTEEVVVSLGEKKILRTYRLYQYLVCQKGFEMDGQTSAYVHPKTDFCTFTGVAANVSSDAIHLHRRHDNAAVNTILRLNRGESTGYERDIDLDIITARLSSAEDKTVLSFHFDRKYSENPVR